MDGRGEEGGREQDYVRICVIKSQLISTVCAYGQVRVAVHVYTWLVQRICAQTSSLHAYTPHE